MVKRAVTYAIFFLVIPCTVIISAALTGGKVYAAISFVVAVLACVPFFMTFEKREKNARRLVIVAVMTALSVCGRFIFAMLPGFKPVTAVVIITAIYFGSEAGFLTGAFTALISNIYFGQGPWTPFQMLAWGLIGFIAGVLAKPLRRRRVLLFLYGALSGLGYAMFMDIWTVIWYNQTAEPALYLTAMMTSLPYTIIYIVSNVIFLWIMAGPIGRKVERITAKYGI